MMGAKMDWSIIPYVSVGPLGFAMTPEQVSDVMGPPETSMTTEQMYLHQFMREKFPDRLRETRDLLGGSRQFPILHYYRSRLVGMEFFSEQKSLRWNDVYLFRDTRPKIIKQLNASGANLVGNNQVLFSFICGLTMPTARHANDQSTVYVFSKDEFPDERQQYTL
jgi:hypothetical protein